jgi:hypothetical protein
MTRIIHATTKAHYQSARELFIQYADSLGFDLEFQGFSRELAGLDCPVIMNLPEAVFCWQREPMDMQAAWHCVRCRIKFVR